MIKEIDEKDFKKMNRRKLLTWAVLYATGFAGLRGLATSETDLDLPWPLRKVSQTTDAFWRANFRENSRAPETPMQTGKMRVNGLIGMDKSVGHNWTLQVNSPGLEEALNFKLEQIKALPKVTESFEFKCIEGWSQNVTVSGVRFSDFLRSQSQQDDFTAYAFALLSTVNGGYYVSMDMKSLLHPQTLLCYEMNGEELTMAHGYPLRLITSVKYGVKNIKQLGSIDFGYSPPADYWAERGYGEYLGL
ncbi:MAG: molybdopterin-dependent oxidoreductase [Bdellovibrio sp.]|nr:molybdopterin-dependent oxidoreductase [Bdellovibrio sp.]